MRVNHVLGTCTNDEKNILYRRPDANKPDDY